MEISLNRYVCCFGTTRMNIDAVDMYTAVKYAVEAKGVEPTSVMLTDVGVAYAKPSSDVTYQAIVETIDAEVPGDVYPREGSCPAGNKIVFTAVPRSGYKFVAYTTPSGTALGTDSILSLPVTANTQILVKFQKIGKTVGSTTTI